MRENNHSRYFGFKAAVLAHQGKVRESKEWLLKYQEERPEIKTLSDYRKVAPAIAEEFIIDGLRKSGLPE